MAKWKMKEVNRLKALLKNHTIAETAKILNRSIGSVKGAIIKFGLTTFKNHTWIKSEDNFIIQNYRLLTDKKIAQKLGLRESQVKARRKVTLGLSKHKPRVQHA